MKYQTASLLYTTIEILVYKYLLSLNTNKIKVKQQKAKRPIRRRENNSQLSITYEKIIKRRVKSQPNPGSVQNIN